MTSKDVVELGTDKILKEPLGALITNGILYQKTKKDTTIRIESLLALTPDESKTNDTKISIIWKI